MHSACFCFSRGCRGRREISSQVTWLPLVLETVVACLGCGVWTDTCLLNPVQNNNNNLQQPSTAINSHQQPSTAIDSHQQPLTTTTINNNSSHQQPSTTINDNDHQQPSTNNQHQQQLSTTINNHQQPSTTINNHQQQQQQQQPSTTINNNNNNHSQPPSQPPSQPQPQPQPPPSTPTQTSSHQWCELGHACRLFIIGGQELEEDWVERGVAVDQAIRKAREGVLACESFFF